MRMRFGLGLIVFCFMISAGSTLATSDRATTPDDTHQRTIPSSSPTITDLWGGGSESIALMSNGSVWTWGWDDYGMLGNGYGPTMFDPSTLYDRWVPFQVLGLNGVGHLSSIQAIAGGERHNVALDTNGQVWT